MLILYISLVTTDSDREFIIKMYGKLNKDLYRYAYSLSRNEEWAKDVTQQVFLIAIEKIQILTQMKDDEVTAYCLTIVKHNFYRRAKANRREKSFDLHEAETANAEMDSVGDAVLTQFEHAEVKACVAKLSETQRDVIALRFGMGLSHAEIAEAMNISVSYSQNLLAGAIGKLRKMLGAEKS